MNKEKMEQRISQLRGRTLDIAVAITLGRKPYSIPHLTHGREIVLVSPENAAMWSHDARPVPHPWPLNQVKTYMVSHFHSNMPDAWTLKPEWFWTFEEFDDWLVGEVLYHVEGTDIEATAAKSLCWSEFGRNRYEEIYATLRSILFIQASMEIERALREGDHRQDKFPF